MSQGERIQALAAQGSARQQTQVHSEHIPVLVLQTQGPEGHGGDLDGPNQRHRTQLLKKAGGGGGEWETRKGKRTLKHKVGKQ